MLIKCKECGKDVSTYAVSCPHCGYPMGRFATPKKTLKYKRLSNGYGQIKKLNGRRRRPYVAYPPTNGYKDNGVAINRPALGYFETYQDAMACLVEYHKNPYDVDVRKVTFAEIYEMFFNDKFVTDQKKQYSVSSKRTAQSAFNHLQSLHNRPIRELRTDDLQEAIDSCPLKHATLEHMVFLIKCIYRFALQHDYIEKNYSEFIKIKIADDDEKGVPFTESEIKTFWKHQNDYTMQIILIMIYSGFRISELETVNIDIENGVFQGGLKTKAGKNRTVPIHSRIMPFVSVLSTTPFKASEYRSTWFYPTLRKLGLSRASTGEKRTPHDCRHTFSWLADKYGIDSLSKHLIMGHSLGADVELSVYGHRTVDELRAEIEKIK